MEAKTASELWNDGVEGYLNLQLYHCDVDNLLKGDPEASPLPVFKLDLPELSGDILQENRMTSPSPDLDYSMYLKAYLLEGQVTTPMNLSNQLDSPTYEELFEQNWQLFEESDQELESCCAHKNVPEDLDLMDSPKVIRPVMPEPTCLTKVIQAMVMYPSSVKKVPKKRKNKHWTRSRKRRAPRTMAVMVSDDENDDKVVSRVQDPPGGTGDFQEVGQSKEPVVGPSSPVRRRARMKNTLRKPPLGMSAEVVPSFAEHFARCAVDWDYPRVLFSMGGYEPEPVSQKMAPPQAGAVFARPVSAQPLAPIALAQKLTAAAGAPNEFLRKKRSAGSNLSDGFHGPASRNVGPENLEPITRSAPRQNKRRRLGT